MTSLDVDEIVAQLLVADGYASVNSIAHATIEALSKINGFDANISQAIKTRAEECVTTMDKKYRDLLKQHSLEDGLDKLPVLQVEDKITLITGDVKTLQDVADLSSMELLDVLPTSGITKKQADKIVMAARKIVYDIDAAE
jgi:N utilization substance protein A